MKLTFNIDDSVWSQALDLAELGKDQDDVILEAITTFVRVTAAKRIVSLSRAVPELLEVPNSAFPTINLSAAIGAGEFWDLLETGTEAIWANAVGEGLPVSFFNALASSLLLKPKELVVLISTKPSALRRWRRSGRLHMAEGDRVYEVAIVIKACVKLFRGDIPAALLWLKCPALVLGNRAPTQFFHTFVGMRLVKSLIWRIENGVVS